MLSTFIYLNFLHSLITTGVCGQHTAVWGIGAPALATTDVPCIAHHEFKVVVIINRCRYVAVVSTELSESDLCTNTQWHSLLYVNRDIYRRTYSSIQLHTFPSFSVPSKVSRNSRRISSPARLPVATKWEQQHDYYNPIHAGTYQYMSFCVQADSPLITSGCLEGSYLAVMSPTSMTPFLSIHPIKWQYLVRIDSNDKHYRNK